MFPAALFYRLGEKRDRKRGAYKKGPGTNARPLKVAVSRNPK